MKTVAYFEQISQPNNRFWQYDSYYIIIEKYRPQEEPKMTPLKWWKDVFDKSGYKKISNSKLLPILVSHPNKVTTMWQYDSYYSINENSGPKITP